MKTEDGMICDGELHTLADHAEAWQTERGRVPPRETPEWQTMYEEWWAFAFQDFGKEKPRRKSSRTRD